MSTAKHVPNYVNPESRGHGLFAAIILLKTLATAVVGLRLWVRYRLLRTVWIDDYLIVASLVGLAIMLFPIVQTKDTPFRSLRGRWLFPCLCWWKDMVSSTIFGMLGLK